MKHFLFVLVLGLLVGCAHRQAVMTSPQAVAAAVDLPPLTPAVHLVVRKGDCLWRIAEQNMETPFYWPELWHANRDQIVDPDEIEPGQDLEIPSVAADRVQWALDTADHWPARSTPSMTRP